MIAIQRLTQGDAEKLRQLLLVYAACFETAIEAPYDDYLHGLLQDAHVCFIVALQGNEIVGGLTAYLLPSAQRVGQELYLYDLAVHPNYQRQGIGRQLLAALRAHAKEIGAQAVFVQADVEDAHALEFYRATGGVGAAVVQFTYR